MVSEGLGAFLLRGGGAWALESFPSFLFLMVFSKFLVSVGKSMI